MGRLVLDRKENERIVIGGSVIVEVVAIRGNRVKLSFQAPPGVVILREEVRDRNRDGDTKEG